MKKYSQIKLLFILTRGFCSWCLTDQYNPKSFTMQSSSGDGSAVFGNDIVENWEPERVWAPQGALPLPIWYSNTYKACGSCTSATPHHSALLQLLIPQSPPRWKQLSPTQWMVSSIMAEKNEGRWFVQGRKSTEHFL